MLKINLSILFIATISTIISACSHANNQQATLDETQWSYATDPYGSEATFKEQLISNHRAWVHFKRIPRVDAQRNSWVELIYNLPEQSLASHKKIHLEYKSDHPLILKLSQKDYGSEGDKSYAHYQIVLPAAPVWNNQQVNIADFQRPLWTPVESKDVGIVGERISAIYLTPSLTDEAGGEATIEIKSLELQ